MAKVPDQLIDQLFDRLLKDGRTADAFAFLQAIIRDEPLEPILKRLDPKLAQANPKPSPTLAAAAKQAVAGATTPAQALAKAEPVLNVRPKMSDDAFVKWLPSADMMKLFNTPKEKREEMLLALRRQHGIANESLTEADDGDVFDDQKLRQFFKGLAQSAVEHGFMNNAGTGNSDLSGGQQQQYEKAHVTDIDVKKLGSLLQKQGITKDEHGALMAMLDHVKKSPDPKNPKFDDPKQKDLWQKYAASVILATTVK